MAEGGGHFAGTDIRLCWCTNCVDGFANSTQPSMFCQQCRRYFCAQCWKDHKEFSSMATHLASKGSMVKRHPTVIPTEICPEHRSQLIELFCRGHDKLCCLECALQSHKQCEGLQYVTRAAAGFRQYPIYTEVRADSKTVIKRLKDSLEAKQGDQAQYPDKLNNAFACIKSYADELRAIINDLETGTMKNIHEKQSKLMDETNSKIAPLTEIVGLLEHYLNVAELPEDYNECIAFVHFNLLKQIYTVWKTGVSAMSDFASRSQINFMIETTIKDTLSRYQSLEHSNRQIGLGPDRFRRRVNITRKTEALPSNITGACRLQNGQFVLIDSGNKELIRFDKEFRFKGIFAFETTMPFDVCATGASEVAVTVPSNKLVVILTIRSPMRSRSSFSVSYTCWGMSFFRDQLYICCNGDDNEGSGCNRVFSLQGVPRQTLQKNIAGEIIVPEPRYIAIDTHRSLLYISDRRKGVVVTDLQGITSSAISNVFFSKAAGLSVVNKNQVAVCGYQSNTVLLIGPGALDRSIISFSSLDVAFPQALCYDANQARLIVTCEAEDAIYLFDFR